MTKIAFRNMFTRPATRRYPFKVREPFAESRGRIVIDFPACIFCGACAKHCPANAIETERPGKTWNIDHFACVSCAACVRACPKKCLSMDTHRPKSVDFADLAGRREEHRAPPEAASPAASGTSPAASPAAPGPT
jgi:formate hydrogenlyase subunit 6/NADH:ubiquinone oxidoreductase subunit I